jgi:cell shape-determining protein MreD
VNYEPRGRMLLTALVALILTVLPLPPMLDAARPAFLVLTVLFWSVNAPRCGGIALGFFAGLMLDVFQGPVLVLVALILYELVLFMIDGWTGHPVTSPLRWLHTLTGALIWPPAAAILIYSAGRRRRGTIGSP